MNERILKAMKSVRTNVPVVLFFGALVLGASACGLGNKGGDTSVNTSGGDQAASAPQAGAPTAPAASAAGVDVQSMDACTIFPGDAVAKALNATLSDPSNTGAGFGGPSCTYGLLTDGAGTGGTQVYILNLDDPKLFDLGLTALVDAKPIAGLGDEAYSGTRVGTSTFEIMIRNAGGVSIDVLGSDADLVRKLAEYVLANL